MANDLNQCNFIGRLGQDPEIKYLPNGDAVANISLAVGESWKDKQSGQKVENTEWVRITAFRKLAEIMGQYLHKGSKVFITGKMKTRKWQAQDGSDRYSTEIIANNMQMLDSKPDGQQGQGQAAPQRQAPQQQTQQGQYQQQQGSQSQQQQQQQAPGGFDDFDDDIPF